MKRPRVSDHALVRYLERTGRLDRKAVEREILTPNLITAARCGVTKYKVNGHTFVLDKGLVVTMINNLRPRGPGPL